jgi:hypothetical protein
MADDALAIPAFLDRTAGMTREQIDAHRDRLIKAASKRRDRKAALPFTSRPDNLTDADRAVIRELKRQGLDRVSAVKQIGAKVKSTQETAMSTKAKSMKAQTKKSPAKKPHPADKMNLDLLAGVSHFSVTLFHDGKHDKADGLTFAEAQAKGAEMEKATGSNRRAIIYGVTKDGQSIPVPKGYAPGAGKPAEAKTTGAKPNGKVAAAAAPAAKKKENKSDVVQRMLTTGNGATREELSKATGWPHVNLKMAAIRAKMKLVETDGRFRLA